MTRKNTPPKFSPDGYTNINLSELVVYSIYYLHRQTPQITAEDIVSACFVLFPQRFSLRKYPQWPDSAAISRRRNDCRIKGYIAGNAAKGFKLTAKGLRLGERLEKTLGKVRPAPRPGREPAAHRTIRSELNIRAGKYIRSIEKSDAYVHYKKKLEVNEFDFRSLLLCTMESPPATLSRNFEQFKEYVNIYSRQDLVNFLEYCGGRFSYLLDMTGKHGRSKRLTSKKGK